MGAVYNEDEELDFSFLRQRVRQQPGGAATGRRQGQAVLGQSRQGQTPQNRYRQEHTYQGQSRTSQSSGGQIQVIESGNRQGQAVRSRSRQGQTGAKRPQTMQEKQRQRQAAALARKKRRLRRQKQLLAALLCILLTASAFAVFQLQREKPMAETSSQSSGQGMNQVRAEAENDAFSWKKIQGIAENQFNQHPNWSEEFLTISEYSRPGEPLTEVNNIFVHYTANPNTSAAQNRNYFENLKDNHDVRGASAHFIIGIEGEILQLVPLDEIAYAVQTRNEDSISIECCYKYDNGQFTQETYDSLIELLAWLVNTYELEADDILRHYDCGGKKCPLYYVEHEDAWRILKQDVEEARK